MKGPASFALAAALGLPCQSTGQVSIGAAASDRQGLVVARAVGEFPTRPLVEFVAENAKESTYRPDPATNIAVTVEEVVESRCGSVQPGYLELLRKANRFVGFSPKARAAGKLVLPACLYASKAPSATTFTARPGDSQTTIAARATGEIVGRVDEPLLRRVFAKITSRVSEGQRVRTAYTSAPTFLTAKNGFAPDLIDGIAAFARTTASEAASEGSIIGPTSTDCEGEAEGYPFRPAELAAAFRLTLGTRNPIATVVGVVDNGFWGVPCRQGACPATNARGLPELNDPFRITFFDTDAFAKTGEIGPLLADRTYPINWRNGLGSPPAINTVSGHGTHVLGLILGGAGFSPKDRDLFSSGQQSWLQLVVMNVAPGALTFPSGSNERMFLLLKQAQVRPRIVNMSLAFDPGHSDFVPGLVDDPDLRGALFVVAAGNSPGSLESRPVYPAILGGDGRENVVTVASVDATGRLSPFTTTSARYVDLAAPGCKLRSWLQADAEPVPVSGTSQAAPVVSLAASLLSALWPKAKPVQIKNRLSYSGELLAEPVDRVKILSGRRLDFLSALVLRRDVVRYVDEAGVPHVVVGDLSQLSGLRCAEDDSGREWATIRSFARIGTGQGSLANAFSDNLQFCDATLSETLPDGVSNEFFIREVKEFDGTRFVPRADIELSVKQLRGFVRAELESDD